MVKTRLIFILIVIYAAWPTLASTPSPCSFYLFQLGVKEKAEPELAPAIRKYLSELIDHLALEGQPVFISTNSSVTKAIETYGDLAISPLSHFASEGEPHQRMAALALLQKNAKEASFAFDPLTDSLAKLAPFMLEGGHPEVLFWQTAKTLIAIEPGDGSDIIDHIVASALTHRKLAQQGLSQVGIPEWVAFASVVASRITELKVALPNSYSPLKEAKAILSDYLAARINAGDAVKSLTRPLTGLAHLRGACLRAELVLGEPISLAADIDQFLRDSEGIPLLRSDVSWLVVGFGWAFPFLTDLPIPESVQFSVEAVVNRFLKDLRVQTRDALASPVANLSFIEIQEGLTSFVECLAGARFPNKAALVEALSQARKLPYMNDSFGYERYLPTRALRITEIVSRWRE